MSRLACVLLTKIGERISASATRGMHAELIEEQHEHLTGRLGER